MDDINLLPWRETLRRVRLRMLWLTATLSVAALVLLGLVSERQLRQQRAPLVEQIAAQARRQGEALRQLQRMQRELAALHSQVPRGQTPSVQTLSLARVAQQLRQAASAIPDAVWLTRLSYRQPDWLLEGQGVSRQDVTAFASHMVAWQWQALSRTDDERWQFTLWLSGTEARGE